MDENGQTKQRARKAALAARDSIPNNERDQRSSQACQKLECLFAMHLEPGATVAVYAAMKSEVDVSPFVQRAFQHGWRMCFPCMVKDEEATTRNEAADISATTATGDSLTATDGGTAATDDAASPQRAIMEFYLVNRHQFENPGETFLAHPLRSFSREELSQAGFVPIAPEKIDAMVAPLVAFDDLGNRLGYGGGNYDRLLARLRPDTIVAGIAFEEQRLAHLPTEPHDRALPNIVVA